MMKKTICNTIILMVFALSLSVSAQDQEFKQYSYKKTSDADLYLNVYYPPNFQYNKSLPAILFFFGGGWVNGDPGQFHPQCVELAKEGIIAIAADYRTRSKHGTSPLESLADAKSAIRWIKSNANILNVDPEKIVAAGGSAGGYLAIALALVEGFNDPQDDTTISTIPAAAVLFNPVINTGTNTGFGPKRFGEYAEKASPLHNVRTLSIPILIMQGKQDQVVSYSNIALFQDKMNQLGGNVWLVSYEDAGHGFFNIRNGDDTYFKLTLNETEKFLRNYSFLP
jgi:acetyl esterase/lipase